MAKAIEPYDPMWMEESVRPENYDAMKKVSDHVSIPLASGESNYGIYEFKQLIERQCLDFLQPDICCCGGVLVMKKIAAMAEAYYIKVAPHNPNGPVATAASLHLSAAIPNFLILETAKNEPHRTLAQRPGGLKIENGWIELPRTPGLGIELDEEAIAAHPYSPRDYASAYYPDGSVADI